ncbi:MAG TPA: cupin domain-containing protein [Patescibacteria group bacterium]|nr:cupin domain-containing protein [Patescibacteria group bacterium]
MKKSARLVLICLFLFSFTIIGAAAPAGQVVGDTSLLDTSFSKGILIHTADWFAAHPLKAGDPTRGDNAFKSPRVQVDLVTNKGPLIGLHYHASADEIVYVAKGQGEMYIDGQWKPVKAGELHINPRGVVHATRVTGNDVMLVIGFFTPPQAYGNDKVFVDKSFDGKVIGNEALIEGKNDTGLLIDLDEWYAAHPLKAGDATRGDNAYASSRAKVDFVTNKGPLIGRHHHSSCEEIVFVYKGQGEMYIDGQWVPVKAGDLHINPRGVIHATRVVGDDEMQVFCIFSPPQANGNDKIFLDQ